MAYGILSGSEEIAQYFAQEIEWIEDRLEIWRARGWRVGVLGITSSGKSTLLNALLRESLLPARVGPSSNNLILCERNDQPQASVLYRDGRTEILETDIAAKLKDRADEAQNPGNRLAIKEIRLTSPKFMLTEGIVLVDTPGLDAHGLQAHEKLTLDVFLPPVDAVLFVSDTKPNSGEKNREYLERIRLAGKPCIYVQNKVDALVPKLGVGGVVVEDVEQIRLKHLKRCKELVDGAFGEDLAHVIQVSARDELDGRSGLSGMGILVDSIEERTASLLPSLQNGRFRQLLAFLGEITRQAVAASSIEEGRAALRTELARAERLRSSAGKIKDDFDAWIKTDARRSRAVAKAIRDDLTSLHRTHHVKAEAVKCAIKEWQVKDWDRLCAAIGERQAMASELAKELNLRDEDFRIPLPTRAARTVRFTAETETFIRERYRGGWGVLDWVFGPIREQATRTVIDVDSVQRQASGILQDHEERYDLAARGLQDLIRRILAPLESELERTTSSLKAKSKSLLDQAMRSEVLEQLRGLRESIAVQLERPQGEGSEVPHGSARGPDLSPDYSRVWLPGYVPDLVATAEVIRRFGFLALGRVLVERSCDGPEVAAVCVCGWDGEACEEVASWFLGALPMPDQGRSKPVVQNGHFCRFVVRRVPSGASSAPALWMLRDGEALPSRSLVFLVLDVDQPGATKSQIHRSGIAGDIRAGQLGLVAVVQSLQCARVNGSDALVESLHETILGLAELGLKPSGLIASDPCLGLSLLIDRIYRIGSQIHSHADEVAWVQALEMNSWPDRSAALLGTEMLKHWRLLLEKSKRGHDR
jgi:GTPase SAR1 family protein